MHFKMRFVRNASTFFIQNSTTKSFYFSANSKHTISHSIDSLNSASMQQDFQQNVTLDIDLSLQDLSSIKNVHKDYSFKHNELILCKIFNKKSKLPSKFTAKIIRLDKNGIFKNKFFDIFHEHIIHRSIEFDKRQRLGSNTANKCRENRNASISFTFDNIRIDFKRPNLYEYACFRVFNAVPSHFSIISLVPLLLELEANSKVLECGTGSGSMSLFLSKHLGQSGILHTFDINPNNALNAKCKFLEWKSSYDLSANENEKWTSNVKFGSADFCNDERLTKHFREFYDAIYLDMPTLEKGVHRAYDLLKPNGVLVLNAMHLTQLIRAMNKIEREKLSLETELVIEPANRFWEMRKIMRQRKETLNFEKESNESEDLLHWTCRLEDRFVEKIKRGGLFFNYWQGFLAKFRKIN